MTSRWAGPLLLASGLVVGCGTRTALLDYENAAGSGASAGSSGTGGVAGSGGATGGTGGSGGTAGYAGTAGVGGSGGTNPACDELVVNGYAIGFEPTPWANQDTPILAPIDDIGPRVAVAVVETPAESPGPVPANLRTATFDAWGDFSAVSLGDGAYPSFVVGVDQVAMDRGTTDGRVAVAYPGAPSPPAYEPTTLFLTSELNPDAPNGQYVSDITTMTADSHLVRFVRRGSWGHLVGLQRRSGEHYGLDLTLVNTEIPEGFAATDMGCATAPMVADAAPVPSGFVYAFSSSREFGGCLLDDGVDGPPSRIHVGAYSNLEMYYSMLPLGFSTDDDVVQFVRLIPHSEGTWLVFQYAGINAEVPPPIQVVRFGNDGTVLDGPFELSDFGIIYTPPAVGRLGDRLVFAWVDASDPFGGTIMMAVVGSGGEITIKTSYSVPDAASVLPKLSVLGSPSADQFVLGWSQWGTSGEMPAEARIAQFSCW